MAFHVPEQSRMRQFSRSSDGNNGAFKFTRKLVQIFVICSDGGGWDHVSVTIIGKDRCPTWEEMCYVKSLFWDDEDCVVQFHPPKSEYINNHEYCLHLWRDQVNEHDTPPKIMIGV